MEHDIRLQIMIVDIPTEGFRLLAHPGVVRMGRARKGPHATRAHVQEGQYVEGPQSLERPNPLAKEVALLQTVGMHRDELIPDLFAPLGTRIKPRIRWTRTFFPVACLLDSFWPDFSVGLRSIYSSSP